MSEKRGLLLLTLIVKHPVGFGSWFNRAKNGRELAQVWAWYFLSLLNYHPGLWITEPLLQGSHQTFAHQNWFIGQSMKHARRQRNRTTKRHAKRRRKNTNQKRREVLKSGSSYEDSMNHEGDATRSRQRPPRPCVCVVSLVCHCVCCVVCACYTLHCCAACCCCAVVSMLT